jgi:chromosome segregation ATPase
MTTAALAHPSADTMLADLMHDAAVEVNQPLRVSIESLTKQQEEVVARNNQLEEDVKKLDTELKELKEQTLMQHQARFDGLGQDIAGLARGVGDNEATIQKEITETNEAVFKLVEVVEGVEGKEEAVEKRLTGLEEKTEEDRKREEGTREQLGVLKEEELVQFREDVKKELKEELDELIRYNSPPIRQT